MEVRKGASSTNHLQCYPRRKASLEVDERRDGIVKKHACFQWCRDVMHHTPGTTIQMRGSECNLVKGDICLVQGKTVGPGRRQEDMQSDDPIRDGGSWKDCWRKRVGERPEEKVEMREKEMVMLQACVRGPLLFVGTLVTLQSSLISK